jgi:serine/threonine-protein phosphatase PP1 catalytic subunit
MNPDTVINKIMGFETSESLTKEELIACCEQVTPILQEQPVLLELQAPLTVCGDIHGQLEDLLRVFRQKGTPPETPYLFLGDYVDRGEHSIEVMTLLLAMKINDPYSIFLLRGNHESPDLNADYGFQDECIRRYDASVWKAFNRVFQWMPLCAIIEGRIFCTHGGLSKNIKSLDDIRKIDRSKYYNIPSEGIVCDLTWADPSHESETWAESDRGCSFTFGPQVVDDFCEKYNFDFVCRAHQVVDHGYEFFCKRKLVTVFTASNYCGDYGNRGSVLTVDADLRCSFIILLPNNKEEVHNLSLGIMAASTESDGRPVSPPVSFRAPSPPPSPRNTFRLIEEEQ